MSLLAEEVVEEWLNRDGFFTIRGVKVGSYEMDVLAIRPQAGGGHQCRHVEVQASINPISYITKPPSAVRKQSGAQFNAKKRDLPLLRESVQEWVEAKFNHPKKLELLHNLCPGDWTKELVVGRVKYEEELSLITEAGVTVHRLQDILKLMTDKPGVVKAASGTDLYDLMQLRE